MTFLMKPDASLLLGAAVSSFRNASAISGCSGVKINANFGLNNIGMYTTDTDSDTAWTSDTLFEIWRDGQNPTRNRIAHKAARHQSCAPLPFWVVIS